jgi:hypothetical protein
MPWYVLCALIVVVIVGLVLATAIFRFLFSPAISEADHQTFWPGGWEYCAQDQAVHEIRAEDWCRVTRSLKIPLRNCSNESEARRESRRLGLVLGDESSPGPRVHLSGDVFVGDLVSVASRSAAGLAVGLSEDGMIVFTDAHGYKHGERPDAVDVVMRQRER